MERIVTVYTRDGIPWSAPLRGAALGDYIIEQEIRRDRRKRLAEVIARHYGKRRP